MLDPEEEHRALKMALSAAVEEFQAVLDILNGRMMDGSTPTNTEIYREEVAREKLLHARRRLWAFELAGEHPAPQGPRQPSPV